MSHSFFLDENHFLVGVSGWSWEWVSGGLEELFFNRVERVEKCRSVELRRIVSRVERAETCRMAANFSPSPPLHGYKSDTWHPLRLKHLHVSTRLKIQGCRH